MQLTFTWANSISSSACSASKFEVTIGTRSKVPIKPIVLKQIVVAINIVDCILISSPIVILGEANLNAGKLSLNP